MSRVKENDEAAGIAGVPLSLVGGATPGPEQLGRRALARPSTTFLAGGQPTEEGSSSRGEPSSTPGAMPEGLARRGYLRAALTFPEQKKCPSRGDSRRPVPDGNKACDPHRMDVSGSMTNSAMSERQQEAETPTPTRGILSGASFRRAPVLSRPPPVPRPVVKRPDLYSTRRFDENEKMSTISLEDSPANSAAAPSPMPPMAGEILPENGRSPLEKGTGGAPL